MAKVYRVGPLTRLMNVPFKMITRLGRGAEFRHLLGVRGRRTGKVYTVPVDVMREGGHRWLVAPYGEVAWVKNARASGQVTLERGSRSEVVQVRELDRMNSVPVIRRYLEEVAIARPYFDVTAGSPWTELAEEAPRHPVFAIDAA